MKVRKGFQALAVAILAVGALIGTGAGATEGLNDRGAAPVLLSQAFAGSANLSRAPGSIGSDQPMVKLAQMRAQGRTERRCGWLGNTTPGNFWLTDRDAEWIIAEQGANIRNGFHDIPGFDFGSEWVRTNGSYGYGCACFDGVVDFSRLVVVRIDRLDPIPLSRCLNDPALIRP